LRCGVIRLFLALSAKAALSFNPIIEVCAVRASILLPGEECAQRDFIMSGFFVERGFSGRGHFSFQFRVCVLRKALLFHCFVVHTQTVIAQKISAMPVGVGISIRAKEARGLRSAEDDLARSTSAVQYEILMTVTRPFERWDRPNRRRN
jgi:hypothetical protein